MWKLKTCRDAFPCFEDRVPARILFVCMGNICRSPTAEAVFRSLAQRSWPELAVESDSAGTHGYHVGRPPDERARAAGGGFRSLRSHPGDGPEESQGRPGAGPTEAAASRGFVARLRAAAGVAGSSRSVLWRTGRLRACFRSVGAGGAWIAAIAGEWALTRRQRPLRGLARVNAGGVEQRHR